MQETRNHGDDDVAQNDDEAKMSSSGHKVAEQKLVLIEELGVAGHCAVVANHLP